ncbi:2-isopropylmalate synthase [Candidatus Hakubella thermalkaliphila]|uniref:Citramalate synthase n=1 Tax=Candidatus Hakubella thermalkaliphila TaxID=2754717 RepID=A0A6V8QB25_9ACTN|nr:2-isopropylmalate synthase [Candidatus Hakubella thermalkaliphila]GFP41992.1 2-isopropylmalate synthase [Candidatus Hakubella thermalkaliphila]
MVSLDVLLYDTTLRDGAQRENLSFSVEDKIRIAAKLAEFGIHYIELGFPHSNPKDTELFRRIRKLDLKPARLVAFGSTRYKANRVEEDPNIRALIEGRMDAICIFGKSWDFHVEKVLETTLEENLKMIYESVCYLKENSPEVIYDAEHFFNAYKSDQEYALKTILAAQEGGADYIVLCDTNGGTLPSEVSRITREVVDLLKVPVGIHAHNDIECAVANTLVAVENGATMVQGTINGYGERCGNANLCSIIPNLVLKKGILCLPKENLRRLTDLSHFVSEVANIVPDSHQPYVGQSAFAHKGGMHVSAVQKDSRAFEHINPLEVGNHQKIVVSELSGKGTIVSKAREFGLDLSKDPLLAAKILQEIQNLEHIGYHFEAADGSFELLVRELTGTARHYFTLESFRVIMEKREDGDVVTEATIKIHVGGQRIIVTAEGNGPVNALDNALRDAIGQAYPQLSKIRLSDFKVRVIDEKKGTAAVVRVLIDTTDGKDSWGTVGVHENIIEASWEALVDSIIYGLMKMEGEGAASE